MQDPRPKKIQPMDYSKTSVSNLVVAFVMFFGVFYLCISYFSVSMNKRIMVVHKDELDIALNRASMANKTVIITVLNKAYAEGGSPGKTMADLFLEGFWLGDNTHGLVNHVLLVAMDQIAFDRCKFFNLNCYKLETEGVNFGGEQLYMTEDFINMMWRRTQFLGEVLKRGYNFIFTDMDVMILRNPVARLISENETVDFQVSCDGFNGNPESEDNHLNTGFYFLRSNNKTIALFDLWYAMKDNSTGMKEQDVLIKLMETGVFKQLGVRVRFLDTLYFSGFCQDSRDFNAVTTVHANCCRSIVAKVADLSAVLRDWKKYKQTMHKYDTSLFKWSNHTACFNSWTNDIQLTR
ncbi:hypothetical protein NE237_027163 [Protea cynaroides]|uniref:Nucleotide-diphospho-sugar transferase domain-containing protein n=1 Tax=Protea cynaroides TaxID=273540 RepID=A0A9Q0GM11_9MAGN|nr:hypothetical protein NE237_027163 [Protea cynaroides]